MYHEAWFVKWVLRPPELPQGGFKKS